MLVFRAGIHKFLVRAVILLEISVDGPKTILALLGASISLLLDMFVAIFSMLFIQNLH